MASSISTEPSRGVEEEFVRGVDPVRPAPHTDDDEHRHQGAFEEHVEQEQVQRGEHPDDQGLQHQEGDHVVDDPVLDRGPAGQDADRHEEGRQQHEQDRNPVHAHVVLGTREPEVSLDKLIGGAGRIEIRDEHDRDGKGHECGQQRDPARRAVCAGLVEQARQQDQPRADQRQEGNDAEDIGDLGQDQAPHV
jgi:hypothetical protein